MDTSSGSDAGGVGGGIAAGSGVTLTIRNSEISGNVGLYGGGGVFLRSGGTLVMEDSEVVGNNSSVDGFGGGLLLVNATASITRSTISNNNAEYSGGGIFAPGVITIIDSTIEGNSGRELSMATVLVVV